jgi:hypothetical protein
VRVPGLGVAIADLGAPFSIQNTAGFATTLTTHLLLSDLKTAERHVKRHFA